MFGPLGAFVAELFRTGTRFTGASLGYQIAGAFGGGFAPVNAGTLLLAAGGPPPAPPPEPRSDANRTHRYDRHR